MSRIAAILLLLLLAGPAVAEDATAPGRYALVPVAGGALRLDTLTGAVSLCAGSADAVSCTPMAEVHGEDDVALLKDRIAKLEARVAALEAQTVVSVPLPDEETMDRVMALADRVMRHFFDLVEDMKRQTDRDEL